ncbi:hypothetical protein G4228_002718 [Cervus hanglu yarkandensis]|nr:hypothetical protein G4228_002718 [Cervus hanglu yarkandensis]
MLPPKSLSATKPKKSWAPNQYELDSDLSEPDAVPGEGATDSEFFHQRFRNFLYVEFLGPRKTLLKLRNLCLDWLQPEIRTKEEIIEVLVLEQYLTILPEKIKPWVQARKPDNCEELVALLEDYEEMYEPEDDNSSDTHSEGGVSRRAAESPPPRPALPCSGDRDRDQDWDQDWERDRERGRARERERRRGRNRDMESRDRWPSVRSPRSRFHQRDLTLPLAERAKEREHRRRDSLLDLDARSEEAVLYQDMVALTEDHKPQNPIQDNMENYRKLLSLGVQLAEDDGHSHMTQGHSSRSKRSAYPSTSRGLKTAPETRKSSHRRGICEAESSHGVIMEKFIKDVARSSRSGRAREPNERPHRLSRRPGGDWKEASFSRREAGASEGGAFGGGGFSCSSDLVSKRRALERKRRYHFDVEGQGPVHDPRGGARKRPFESGGEARKAARAVGGSNLGAPPVALSQPPDLGAMPYVCDECGRSFAVISEFVDHQIVHTRESLYEYGESFVHSAAVSEAQSRPAGARRPEGAQAAGATGPAERRRGPAREHLGGSGDEEQHEPHLPSPTVSQLQKMYGKDKFYECKVCKETFLHSSALIEHQKIHSREERERERERERSTGAVRRTPMLGELQRACGKEKRYECKVCGETFHHSAALREHQKIHSRGSPSDGRARAFEETFIPGQSLKRRQKTYSKEKLYDFREGGDAFGRSSDFMEHQKIHSRKSCFDSRGYEKPLLHSMSMPGSQKSHTITRPPEDEDDDDEKAFTISSNPEDSQEARAYERSAYERAIFHSLAAFRPPRGLREDGEPSTYLSGLRDPPQKTPAWESPYAGGRHSFFRSSVFYRASRPAPLDHLAGEGPSGWKRDGEASGSSSDGRQHQKARSKKKNIERKNYDTSMMHTLRFGEPQTFRPRERFYECQECGEFFVRSSELAEHQKIHSRKKLPGNKNYLRSVLRSLTSTDPQTSYQGQSLQMSYVQEAAQTTQISYIEEPAQTSYTEEPAQTSYIEELVQTSYAEEPAQTSYAEEPAQTRYAEEPAQASYAEEPAQARYAEEPAQARYAEEPPAETSYAELVAQISYAELAAPTSYAELAAETSYFEPPAQASYTEPAETSYADPAAQVSFEEPPAEATYADLSAEISYAELATETSYAELAAQISYDEPPTETSYAELGAQISYSEPADQTSYAELTAQTSYSEPPAQTSYAELTSEASYCEPPVLNECKECGECFATVEELARHQKIYARENFHDGKLFGEPVMPDLGLDGPEGEEEETEEQDEQEEQEEQDEPEEPEDSIYGCKDCGLGFADRADLRDHQKVHRREPLVESREYTRPAVHAPPVSEYQKDCLGEQLYECPACGESFVHSSFLFEHQKVHEQDQFYGHRRYEPFMQPLIAAPRRPQAPPKSVPFGAALQCQVCGQDFIHASVLSEHVRGHAGEGLPDQGQGGAGAAGPGPAPTEPQQGPGEEPRYECETCGESFPSQADLQEHMRVHEKSEPYAYGAAFVHTSFLTEPPRRDWPFYECKDCGKSFIHSTILAKHQRLHLQEDGAAAAAAAAQGAEANVLVPREVLRLQGSNVGAAEPEAEAAEPEVEAAEPEAEAAEPEAEAEGPEWEAAEPSGEAEQPHAEAEQPDMDADEPDGAGIEDPEERAEEPEGDADEPDGAGIEDPEEEGEEQEIQVEEPYYDCGECGETFPSGAAYAEHLTAHASLIILEPAGLYGEGAGGPEGGRPDDELFKCDVCGQLFSDRLSLARHQNTHTG